MPLSANGESKLQDKNDVSRIPQRQPIARPRFAVPKQRIQSHAEQTRQNRSKDEVSSEKQNTKFTRPATLKRPSTIPRRTTNEIITPKKPGRNVITVPVSQRLPSKLSTRNYHMSYLPDQESIQRREDLELKRETESDEEEETISSEHIMQLKIDWQEKMIKFEKHKSELEGQQTSLIELYASMREMQKKMLKSGQETSLPENLNILNVAKLTPEELLKLCDGSQKFSSTKHNALQHLPRDILSIDVNKLNDMPLKLVATCELTLAKRKDIIDWFEKLIQDYQQKNEKGIRLGILTTQMQEFSNENRILAQNLDHVKNTFFNEYKQVQDQLRKSINDVVTLKVRTDEFTIELSQLQSKNEDLQKQLNSAEHLRSRALKNRVEELEKMMSEEKSKNIFLKNRLSNETKLAAEKFNQVESALDQSRQQNRTLERTVKLLQDQNHKLQSDFEEELNKLTESIKEHTVHLEEIASSREKLRVEKVDLEKRLNDISETYNDSIKTMKHEMNLNVAKLIETERKYSDEVNHKKKIEDDLNSLAVQLKDAEQRYNEVCLQVSDKDYEIKKLEVTKSELEITKKELMNVNMQLEDYKERVMKQCSMMKEIEENFIKSMNMEEDLKCKLSNKDAYILDLENKLELLEQQMCDSESKMAVYEDQLESLKNHIVKLREDFGDYENIDELNELLNQQREKLLEATRQSGELAETVQKKNLEIDKCKDTINEQEQLLDERDNMLKVLSQKEKEQSNIIKILQNNLEVRNQTDTDLSRQLSENNEAMKEKLENSNNHISHLEKIILTLEEQARNANRQRLKDQDKIKYLERTLIEIQTNQVSKKHGHELHSNKLDNLISILEKELDDPFTDINKQNYKSSIDENNTNKGSISDKVVLGELAKDLENKCKTFNNCTINCDKLKRKRAVTNIDGITWLNTNNYVASKDNSVKKPIPVNLTNDGYIIPNFHLASSHQLKDDKKIKMFRLAGHRL